MTGKWNSIFDTCIDDYHVSDNVDTEIKNPYPADSLEHLMYLKNWIDTVQWHLEDIIRREDIDPSEALARERRTDRVEPTSHGRCRIYRQLFSGQIQGCKQPPATLR